MTRPNTGRHVHVGSTVRTEQVLSIVGYILHVPTCYIANTARLHPSFPRSGVSKGFPALAVQARPTLVVVIARMWELN